MRWIWMLLLLTATQVSAFEIRDDIDWPLPESPSASILVARITVNPDGSACPTDKWHKYVEAGSLAQVCATVGDGICCPCNAKPDGRHPECGFVLNWTPQSTTGECTQKVWDGPTSVPKGMTAVAKRDRSPTGECKTKKQHGCYRTEHPKGIVRRGGKVVE